MKVSSLEAILRALADADARYLIVGGLAVAAHGYGRLTFDLDLVVQLQPDNVVRALKALESLGYMPLVPVPAADFADPAKRESWIREKNAVVFQLHSERHRETRIDLFVTEPFDFEQEYARAKTSDLLPGLPARFVRLETLIRMKETAGREKDLALLRSLCPGLSFELLDRALIALQGPAAEDAFALLKPQVRSLRFMQAAAFDGWLVSRSGYTGEDGFEISLSNQEAEPLARELLKIPAVKPVGLGARDTLRLEAGLHLYGQDMDAGTTVVEANLGWAVARSRRAGGRKAGGFPGAAVYLKEAREGAKRKLVGLIGDEPVPIRHGSPILSGNAEVGVVTSGTVSPSTQRAIMLGYVGVPHLDKPLSASVRGAPRPIRITSLPFVPKRYRK